MILIQVVPRAGYDAYQLLRHKVIHDAQTWYWGNKKKTRLRHVQSDGWIDVHKAGTVLMAKVCPKVPKDIFYLTEKFMSRLLGWFSDELAAINLQLLDEE